MSGNTVKQLPPDTVKLITSTQIVTSVSTTVKELFENAIDAGATIIQVRLDNYGLDLIEIKDNGSGISYDNVQRMFLPGYTSKIREFEDLGNLRSYGFRGEALAAICKVAKITLTTKTCLDTLAMTYDIDSTGLPLSSKPTHLNNGTVLTVTHLFSNLPVRRMHLSSKKKMVEELKKTEQTVQSLSLIHPELNVSLVHNKCIVWKKNSVRCLKQSFMQVVSLKTVSKMDHINNLINKINIDLIVPKKNLEEPSELFTNSINGIYVYVNKRPVTCKTLSQPVQEHIFYHFNSLDITQKYSVCLISVNIPPQLIDINLEPNKTKVLLKNELDIIKILDETLLNYYNNGNFHCTALKEITCEENVGEQVENLSTTLDDSVEEHLLKRPRLEPERQEKPPGRSIDRFIKKNWQVDIINEDTATTGVTNTVKISGPTRDPSDAPQSLCSQINKGNCVLTTVEEVTQLNTLLDDQHFQSVITLNNKNSAATRLMERNELQTPQIEKRTLPEWPVRNAPKEVLNEVVPETQESVRDEVVPETQESVLDEVVPETEGSVLDEVRSKTIQEIAAEIENDVDVWSKEVSGVLLKKEINSSPSTSTENAQESICKFDLTIDNISSQMGKKELKTFTKFCRIMRPKIVSEFPKLVFTEVARLLAERWKALTPTEVKYYENLSEIGELNKRSFTEVSKHSEAPKKSHDKSLKTLFEQIKRRNRLSRPPRREVTLVTSLNQIKCLIEKVRPTREEPEERQYKKVGQLQPSHNWLYVRGKEIGHIRHQGLREAITYQKMLASHSVSRKPLDKHILVDQQNLGDDLWQVLISLELEDCEHSSKFRIASDVIVKNGFQIEVEKFDGTGRQPSQFYITEVAAEIPQFGIADLKDALALYAKNGEAGGLTSWRPTSVCSYLTNEAIRLSQSSVAPDMSEIEEMLNTYHLCLRHLPPVCLHSTKYFAPIHHIQ
ncbi:hypothetical protein RUM43_007616 [Polyplax serrata]|uniref:HMG box domain-containing protein n=1 Tax=Polyplax serrata TaxID=468196 RepID=A0AAN8P655_POLSC